MKATRALRALTVALFTALPALCLVQPAARAQTDATSTWKIAPAPLLTRYARDVNSANPRPEYPRPQLVRREWQSLNGLWDFAFSDAHYDVPGELAAASAFPHKILVPFTFESALSGLGRGKEIHEHVSYRRTFTVPPDWRADGKRLLMNFGAVDWQTVVYVNGKEAGRHTGGYAPFSLDVTEFLQPGNVAQEVVVSVYDPADPSKEGWQPKGKQLGSEGIWYTRTTGIWQSVWMEPVSLRHLERVRMIPGLSSDARTGTLAVMAAFDNKLPAGPEQVAWELTASIGRDGKTLATARTDSRANGEAAGASLNLTVPNVKPWTPESPTLYDVTYTLKVDGKVTDTVQSYTAFRQVGIKNGRLTLNGKPYFYRGVLDQGFWPDGIYTPPTDAAIQDDVLAVKTLGFNMARKHVKVEDPRWYYWCDKLGVAVWQDMPSSHNLSTDLAKQNFERELTDVVGMVANYPCVVHYIPFNENWGNPQEFQDQMVTLLRRLDSTRPITDASGWTQRSLTDVIDAHDYGNRLAAQGVPQPVKPKVVGEYGGIALPIEGHTWSSGWGYQSVRDGEGLVKRVGFQTGQLFNASHLSGFVYTQLTDVEQELNGLLTYDRRPKADMKAIAPVFAGKARARGEVTALSNWLVLGPVPSGGSIASGAETAESEAKLAQVLDTAQLPDEAQLAPRAGAPVPVGGVVQAWRAVRAKDGAIDFNTLFGGQTDNAVVYAVTYINCKHDQKNASLLLGSDDGAVIYLNGQKVGQINRVRGLTPDEDIIALPLKAGRNTLVIKVGQGTGGWGLSGRLLQ